MKQSIQLLTISLIILPIASHAQNNLENSIILENEVVSQIITAATQTNDPSLTEYHLSTNELEVSIESLSSEQLINSIMQNFFGILNNPQNIDNLSDRLRIIMNSLLQLGFNALHWRNSDKIDYATLKAYIESLDQKELEKIAQSIQSQLMQYKVSKKNNPTIQISTNNTQTIEDVVVINHFQQLVNGFFNIALNPHNKNNVAANITNMLNHGIQIALLATKNNNYSSYELMRYIKELDTQTKLRMAEIVYSQAE